MATGVMDLDGSLTPWENVEQQAAGLAAALQERAVKPGDRVTILLPKSLQSFVAVHGVLLAGAVAVPLDPLGAAAALSSIIEQCEPAAVIGAPDTLVRLLPDRLRDDAWPVVHTGGPEVLLDADVAKTRLTSFDTATRTGAGDRVPVDPEDPAYIIFTSGSTGTPKGIVHSHRSAMAYAQTAVEVHRLDPSSRVAGIPPLHFDMSTLELYCTPLAGGTAVTISEAEQRFPATLSQRLADTRVTHLYAVPFLLRQLQERGALVDRDLSALRHIGYAGEPYAPGAVAELMASLPDVPIVNLYGPAETNVVTSHAITGMPQVGSDVPIGRLWPDCELRLVTEDNTDAPPGGPGELWVSAPTCMLEYWKLPALTASRLHPRSNGWPWYATGDIVRVDADGLIHYLGRRDHQVKIRGVRLELEAIEAVLTDAPGIEHAVAGAVDEDGQQVLVAAVVTEFASELDLRAVKRWCAGRLPAAAVPSHIAVRTSLPTTGSGKIDRAQVRRSLGAALAEGREPQTDAHPRPDAKRTES